MNSNLSHHHLNTTVETNSRGAPSPSPLPSPSPSPPLPQSISTEGEVHKSKSQRSKSSTSSSSSKHSRHSQSQSHSQSHPLQRLNHLEKNKDTPGIEDDYDISDCDCGEQQEPSPRTTILSDTMNTRVFRHQREHADTIDEPFDCAPANSNSSSLQLQRRIHGTNNYNYNYNYNANSSTSNNSVNTKDYADSRFKPGAVAGTSFRQRRMQITQQRKWNAERMERTIQKKNISSAHYGSSSDIDIDHDPNTNEEDDISREGRQNYRKPSSSLNHQYGIRPLTRDRDFNFQNSSNSVEVQFVSQSTFGPGTNTPSYDNKYLTVAAPAATTTSSYNHNTNDNDFTTTDEGSLGMSTLDTVSSLDSADESDGMSTSWLPNKLPSHLQRTSGAGNANGNGNGVKSPSSSVSRGSRRRRHKTKNPLSPNNRPRPSGMKILHQPTIENSSNQDSVHPPLFVSSKKKVRRRRTTSDNHRDELENIDVNLNIDDSSYSNTKPKARPHNNIPKSPRKEVKDSTAGKVKQDSRNNAIASSTNNTTTTTTTSQQKRFTNTVQTAESDKSTTEGYESDDIPLPTKLQTKPKLSAQQVENNNNKTSDSSEQPLSDDKNDDESDGQYEPPSLSRLNITANNNNNIPTTTTNNIPKPTSNPRDVETVKFMRQRRIQRYLSKSSVDTDEETAPLQKNSTHSDDSSASASASVQYQSSSMMENSDTERMKESTSGTDGDIAPSKIQMKKIESNNIDFTSEGGKKSLPPRSPSKEKAIQSNDIQREPSISSLNEVDISAHTPNNDSKEESPSVNYSGYRFFKKSPLKPPHVILNPNEEDQDHDVQSVLTQSTFKSYFTTQPKNSQERELAYKWKKQKLKLLHHVLTCTHPPPPLVDMESEEFQKYEFCQAVPHCDALQTLVKHVQTCSFTPSDKLKTCDVPGCNAYKKVWNHYRRCVLRTFTSKSKQKKECMLCGDLWKRGGCQAIANPDTCTIIDA